MAAVPMVTPSSPAICGSSGSHTRRLAALANEASARTAIARVGVSPASVDVVELTSNSRGGIGKCKDQLLRGGAAIVERERSATGRSGLRHPGRGGRGGEGRGGGVGRGGWGPARG